MPQVFNLKSGNGENANNQLLLGVNHGLGKLAERRIVANRNSAAAAEQAQAVMNANPNKWQGVSLKINPVTGRSQDSGRKGFDRTVSQATEVRQNQDLSRAAEFRGGSAEKLASTQNQFNSEIQNVLKRLAEERTNQQGNIGAVLASNGNNAVNVALNSNSNNVGANTQASQGGAQGGGLASSSSGQSTSRSQAQGMNYSESFNNPGGSYDDLYRTTDFNQKEFTDVTKDNMSDLQNSSVWANAMALIAGYRQGGVLQQREAQRSADIAARRAADANSGYQSNYNQLRTSISGGGVSTSGGVNSSSSASKSEQNANRSGGFGSQYQDDPIHVTTASGEVQTNMYKFQGSTLLAQPNQALDVPLYNSDGQLSPDGLSIINPDKNKKWIESYAKSVDPNSDLGKLLASADNDKTFWQKLTFQDSDGRDRTNLMLGAMRRVQEGFGTYRKGKYKPEVAQSRGLSFDFEGVDTENGLNGIQGFNVKKNGEVIASVFVNDNGGITYETGNRELDAAETGALNRAFGIDVNQTSKKQNNDQVNKGD